MAEEYEVLYDAFPELAAALRTVVSQMVRKSAFDIQRLAAQNAPVDTGFLKNSIYTVTKHSSNYGSNYGEGASTPPSGDAQLLDEVPAPTSETEAVVAVGANYGVFVELGTVHAPAQPYLVPAADAVAPQLTAALTRLEDLLKTLGSGGSGSGSE